jgi:hypothetical protein
MYCCGPHLQGSATISEKHVQQQSMPLGSPRFLRPGCDNTCLSSASCARAASSFTLSLPNSVSRFLEPGSVKLHGSDLFWQPRLRPSFFHSWMIEFKPTQSPGCLGAAALPRSWLWAAELSTRQNYIEAHDPWLGANNHPTNLLDSCSCFGSLEVEGACSFSSPVAMKIQQAGCCPPASDRAIDGSRHQGTGMGPEQQSSPVFNLTSRQCHITAARRLSLTWSDSCAHSPYSLPARAFVDSHWRDVISAPAAELLWIVTGALASDLETLYWSLMQPRDYTVNFWALARIIIYACASHVLTTLTVQSSSSDCGVGALHSAVKETS